MEPENKQLSQDERICKAFLAVREQLSGLSANEKRSVMQLVATRIDSEQQAFWEEQSRAEKAAYAQQLGGGTCSVAMRGN